VGLPIAGERHGVGQGVARVRDAPAAREEPDEGARVLGVAVVRRVHARGLEESRRAEAERERVGDLDGRAVGWPVLGAVEEEVAAAAPAQDPGAAEGRGDPLRAAKEQLAALGRRRASIARTSSGEGGAPSGGAGTPGSSSGCKSAGT